MTATSTEQNTQFTQFKSEYLANLNKKQSFIEEELTTLGQIISKLNQGYHYANGSEDAPYLCKQECAKMVIAKKKEYDQWLQYTEIVTKLLDKMIKISDLNDGSKNLTDKNNGANEDFFPSRMNDLATIRSWLSSENNLEENGELLTQVIDIQKNEPEFVREFNLLANESFTIGLMAALIISAGCLT